MDLVMKKKGYERVKSYFRHAFELTSYKVALIGLLLAVTTLISLLEIPTFFAGFLKMDFGNTVLLVTLLILKLPYALVIAILTPWLRLVLPHFGGGDVIGELAYMLSSITLLLLYSSLRWIGYQLYKPHSAPKKHHHYQEILIIELPVLIITCLLLSLCNTFYNFAFILDLYHLPDWKTKVWTIFLPYNLFKFTLIFMLYLLLFHPVQVLIRHFNF